jgi:hypothetical protein
MLIHTLHNILPSQNGRLVIVLTFTIVSLAPEIPSLNPFHIPHDLPYFAGLKASNTCKLSSTIPLIFTLLGRYLRNNSKAVTRSAEH